MTRHPDIIFSAEYIKNVLYFATIRQGKVLKSTSEIHYFCIDNELVYENYYSDFGPLNLGCVYKYCKILNEKLKQFLNKQTIVHYTSCDPRKKANAAFLLGSYGILYLSLMPRDALKPLLVHGQIYRPFQDATQGDSVYTISIMDCLCALKKAHQLGFFNFQDFNYEEYERLDKIHGGDLNWIVPGKFLAFIGPVDYSVSLFHPPEMYIDYFKANDVKIVIRLNKQMYDGRAFSNVGIEHYDLFLPDGSCPRRHILLKFLQIAEEADGALAVHCKAGLGRTGSLIGCYLIKHYRMTAHEAIGWMRICRPGSVIGHQQEWLEHLETWLIKQGNLYRKRIFQDIDKLPLHEFGIYSISEKMAKQRPVVMSKPSSQTPVHRQTRSEITPPVRPQASKVREETEEEERPDDIDNEPTAEKQTPLYDESETPAPQEPKSFWQKYFCCGDNDSCEDCFWALAVDCANITSLCTKMTVCCDCLDRVAISKAAEKEQQDWRVRTSKMNNSKMASKGSISHRESVEVVKTVSRRSSGAGEPRQASPRQNARGSAMTSPVRGTTRNNKESVHDVTRPHMSTFRTTQGPVIKTLSDAKDFLIRSSVYGQQRDKHLNQSITVTPRYTMRPMNYVQAPNSSMTHNTANSPFSSAPRNPPAMARRRPCLGRSPSPSPSPSPTRLMDHTRATNTLPFERYLMRDSKTALRDALSRLNLSGPRDGSIGAASVGAASLGARRDAPPAKRAPSVHSDERPLATQGDMLNSIKFQRRFRDTLNADKISAMFNEKQSLAAKEKFRAEETSRVKTTTSKLYGQEHRGQAGARLARLGARAAGLASQSPPGPLVQPATTRAASVRSLHNRASQTDLN